MNFYIEKLDENMFTRNTVNWIFFISIQAAYRVTLLIVLGINHLSNKYINYLSYISHT